jgi:hypothetical protein
VSVVFSLSPTDCFEKKEREGNRERVLGLLCRRWRWRRRGEGRRCLGGAVKIGIYNRRPHWV